MTGPDGASHQALEEITLTRVLPNLTVFVPCDYIEAKKATLAAAKIKGPVYIRLGREAIPIITTADTVFEPGRGIVMRPGTDLTIIACGVMVNEALQAAVALQERGISARVVNLHTLKPLDETLIEKCARETGAIVTAEEHEIYGGLGGAISEAIVKSWPVPVEMVGVKDQFGESGQPEELLRHFNLKDTDIVAAAEKVLARKNKKQGI